MLPTEQSRFFALVTEALAEYVKRPDQGELEAWWSACRSMPLADVERAFKGHSNNADDGKRAPRPVDIKRRVGSGAKQGNRCSATDSTGQCEYPGVFSDGTSGGEAWYCAWHRIDRAGDTASRFIEASRSVPYEHAMAKRMNRMQAESIRAPAVIETAHAIALRHGAKPWQATQFSAPKREEEAA